MPHVWRLKGTRCHSLKQQLPISCVHSHVLSIDADACWWASSWLPTQKSELKILSIQLIKLDVFRE